LKANFETRICLYRFKGCNQALSGGGGGGGGGGEVEEEKEEGAEEEVEESMGQLNSTCTAPPLPC
jgi:hypothetical protein